MKEYYYSPAERPSKCPYCGSVQSCTHKVWYQCIECKEYREVMVRTIVIRSARETAIKRCRSCSKKTHNLRPETRAAISAKSKANMNGFRHTDESKAKLSASYKAHPNRGRCHPVYLKHHDGTEFWVQGTYEEWYAQQLLARNVRFDAHPEPLEYFDGKIVRKYFPDFYLSELDTYVEIKSRYTFKGKQVTKLQQVRSQRKVNIEVLVLTKKIMRANESGPSSLIGLKP